MNNIGIGMVYHVGWIKHNDEVKNIAYRQLSENTISAVFIDTQKPTILENPVFVDAPEQDPERWGYL